jgi:hypothetical protein
MGEGVDGVPAAMRNFAAQLPPPDFSAVQSDAQASLGTCGGGLLECPQLNEAVAQAVATILRFTETVARGTEAYQGIANGSAADYTDMDVTSRALMPVPLNGPVENQ